MVYEKVILKFNRGNGQFLILNSSSNLFPGIHLFTHKVENIFFVVFSLKYFLLKIKIDDLVPMRKLIKKIQCIIT